MLPGFDIGKALNKNGLSLRLFLKMKFLSAACKLLLIPVFLFGKQFSFAQQAAKSNRILVLLDASSSMSRAWDDSTTRYKAASTFINALIDSTYSRNYEVEFALRAYGQQSAPSQNDCFDTKMEVMFSRDNATQMELRLLSLKPKGISNTAFAVEEAVKYDLSNTDHYQYSIVIITDGGESCGNDICNIAQNLKAKLPPICTISLTNDAGAKNEYACLGKTYTLTRAVDIPRIIKELQGNCCNVPYLRRSEAKLELPKPSAPKISKPTPVQPVKAVVVFADTIKPKPQPIENVKPARKSRMIVSDNEDGVINGYLKISEGFSISAATLFYMHEGSYRFYTKQLEKDTQNRIPLPEGDYRILFIKVGQEIYRDFKIRAGAVTDIGL